MSGRGDLISPDPPFDNASAALRPAFTITQVPDDGLDVRDDLQKLVCRVAVTELPGWGWGLTLDPLRGFDAERDRIMELLLGAGFKTEDDLTSVAVALDASDRADGAVARIGLRLLQIIDSNLPGTLADTDLEFLHDYRVAIRRTRSVLKEMRGVFPAVELARLRVEFRWLQEVTSQTRDLDVYLADFETLRELAPVSVQPDLEPLLAVLRSWHLDAREQMERELVSERAKRLHEDWAALLEHLPELPQFDRPDATRGIGDVASERILEVHGRMIKDGRRISSDSEPQEYHDLRKKGKELRYLLELFAAPMYDPSVVKPMIKALKGLQDVLGTHQDREIQVETLRRLGDHVLAQAGGARALLAMGALVERLEQDAQDARDGFAARFKEFASDEQSALFSDTFHGH